LKLVGTRAREEPGLNLSTFYVQLLHTQIPKSANIQSSGRSFSALLGSVHVKAERKMLVKLTRGEGKTASIEGERGGKKKVSYF